MGRSQAANGEIKGRTMIVTRKTTKEIEYTVDVLCNKCGESCIPPTARDRREGQAVKWIEGQGHVAISQEEALILYGPVLYGLIEASVTGGYESYALEDMQKYTFSLCEICLKQLFDAFKIPVAQREYNMGEG